MKGNIVKGINIGKENIYLKIKVHMKVIMLMEDKKGM
jgi:hypothetical protein